MAAQTKSYQTQTDFSTWTNTPGNASTTASIVNTSPGGQAGSGDYFLQMATAGKNKSSVNYWQLAGTWADLFGIPTNAIVTNILASGDGYYGKCTAYNTGGNTVDGPVELRNSSNNVLLTLVSGRSFSAIDGSWVHNVPGTLNQSIPSAQRPATTSIRIWINSNTSTGNSSSGSVTLGQDYFVVTITYSVPTGTVQRRIMSATLRINSRNMGNN